MFPVPWGAGSRLVRWCCLGASRLGQGWGLVCHVRNPAGAPCSIPGVGGSAPTAQPSPLSWPGLLPGRLPAVCSSEPRGLCALPLKAGSQPFNDLNLGCVFQFVIYNNAMRHNGNVNHLYVFQVVCDTRLFSQPSWSTEAPNTHSLLPRATARSWFSLC